MHRSVRFAGSSLLATLFLLGLQARAQQAAGDAKPADATAADTSKASAQEQVYQLSPFKVSTDKDKGYKATNTTSGTRLDTAIKDLPMPIEVITDQFISDIGARDLRQSLAYSAGIQTQTQNDYGSSAIPYGNNNIPGRINSAEGSTANANQSVVKIRGYDTEATLRDGFRRQNSTDSVNISRVEVIRGPNALLYGVGNFGGVVNYLVKQPEAKASQAINAQLGSYGLRRATLDVNQPITDTVGARVTGAWQESKDNTDWYKENHFFVSPIVVWKPYENTEVLIDTEFGKQNRSGIGFQDLRAVQSPYVNGNEGYGGDFMDIPGHNKKNFRWSGPDTYNNSEAYNFEVKLTQKLAEGLNFSVGYNSSAFSYDQRDVSAAIVGAQTSSTTPPWAIASIVYKPLANGQLNFPTTPQPSTIWYQWSQQREHDRHSQVRTDLTYNHKLFEDRKWLKSDHTFLLGINYVNETHEQSMSGTVFDRNMFKNPTDFSPFRFGHEADGTVDAPMDDMSHVRDITQDAADYAVYQGKFLDNRLILIAGVRKDRSWNKNWHYNPQWGYGRQNQNSGDKAPVSVYGEPSKDTTKQFGADIHLTKSGSLSLFVMSAEAIQPNYSGATDLSLVPLKAALGKDKEIGLKFDLFDGRVSGTVSRFNIDRTRVGIGNPGSLWWAPINAPNSNFDPNKHIIYNVTDQSPDLGSGSGWNGFARSLWPAFNTALAAGAITKQDANHNPASPNWQYYVDASTTAGATYMDTVFAQMVAQKTGYGTWLWQKDSITNNSSADQNANHGNTSVPTGEDKSTGWDAQVLINFTDNLSLSLSYAHTEKVVVHASQFAQIKYGYNVDRWAIWYAPGWPYLAPGQTAKDGYADPNNTSTNHAFGDGLPLDDTPTNAGSAWLHYEMPKTSTLHGLSFGIGANYQGKGQIAPLYSFQYYDQSGKVITIITQPKTIYNGMARYEFKVRGHDASVQLNIDNLANNTDYYGSIPNAPRKWSLTYSQKL